MTTLLLTPRVLPAGVRGVPVLAPRYSPLGVTLFFGAVALLCAGLAFAAPQAGLRVFLALVAVLAVGTLVGMRGLLESVTPGAVRVASSGPLRFVAPAAVRAVPAVLSVLLLLPGVAALWSDLAGAPPVAAGGLVRWSPYGLALLGLAGLGRGLWMLRLPAGLTLTADGVRGVRGARPVELRWEELAGVGVVAQRGAQLALRTAAGDLLRVEAYAIGSDPNVVAPLLDHFLRHPADRALLAEPRRAVERVEALARS